jgi:hypothetical protein
MSEPAEKRDNDCIEVVSSITSPSLYKFVFVFYKDVDKRMLSGFQKSSDYQSAHHTREDDVDEIIRRYGLPDWRERKRTKNKAWREQWGRDMKKGIQEIMESEGLILTREVDGDKIRVKYVWRQ